MVFCVLFIVRALPCPAVVAWENRPWSWLRFKGPPPYFVALHVRRKRALVETTWNGNVKNRGKKQDSIKHYPLLASITNQPRHRSGPSRSDGKWLVKGVRHFHISFDSWIF